MDKFHNKVKLPNVSYDLWRDGVNPVVTCGSCMSTTVISMGSECYFFPVVVCCSGTLGVE